MPLSPDTVNRLEELRQLLLVENGSQSTRFCFEFNDAQVLDLASGFVPPALKAAFLAALDWHEEDIRRAAANVARDSRRTHRRKHRKAPTTGGEEQTHEQHD